MIVPMKDDLFAFRYSTFSHIWEDFEYDISDLSYYGEIRNLEGQKVGQFIFVKGIDSLICSMTKEDLINIPKGVYNYDIKQVNQDNSSQDIIIYGSFTVKEAITQIP